MSVKKLLKRTNLLSAVFTAKIMALLVASSMYSNAQIITDAAFRTFYPSAGLSRSGGSFTAGKNVLPITLNQKISGLSISGNIIFTGEKGFVRIVLESGDGNEYLVLETNTLFEDKTNVAFNEFCDETALLDNISPKRLVIESTDAEVKINGIQYATENKYQASQNKQMRGEQLDIKIKHINAVLSQKEITWGAGRTSVSEMSYMEKKKLHGGTLPNLAGFEYYVSGIYVKQGYNASNVAPTRNNFVPEFDWRNRHGKNWVTPVKNQASCGSCWAFAVVGVVEAYTNLYYNDTLNLDLSEQDILSCSGAGSCNGGYLSPSFEYIRTTGAVSEECFQYDASDLPCGNKCSTPAERIKIESHTYFNTYTQTSDDLKKLVIKAPTSFGISSWSHALGLMGFKTIQIGDVIEIRDANGGRWVTVSAGDPLIGSTAWLLKNSWGTSSWGDEGFGYVVVDWYDLYHINSVSGGVTSLNYTDSDIVCEDRDGDGYYNWGVGPKPSTCPLYAQDEPDGDDSNPNLGPMDEYGFITVITPSIGDTIAINLSGADTSVIDSIRVSPTGITIVIQNPDYLNGAMISVRNMGLNDSNVVEWFGGIDQNNAACTNYSENLFGNGAQINNFVSSKDANDNVLVFIQSATSDTNTVELKIYNWANGQGCPITRLSKSKADVNSSAAVVAPSVSLAANFSAGPNPVPKLAGKVGFFREGKSATGTLTIYNATGKVVRKIKITDNTKGNLSRRPVGAWDLKDSKGRPVSEGSYVVKGTVKTSDGKTEKISIILGVR
jgi:C1A family cysteine protease